MRVDGAHCQVVEGPDQSSCPFLQHRLVRFGKQIRIKAHHLRLRISRQGGEGFGDATGHLSGCGLGKCDRHDAIQHMGGDLGGVGIR